jgi:hypothetical protein
MDAMAAASVFSASSLLASLIRVDQSEHSAAELHRSSYLGAVSFRASALPDQIVVAQALAVGRGEHGIDPPAFLSLAPIIAPCGLADILINVLFANPMMDTVNLPFQQRPETFDRVGVRVIPDVLTLSVVDDFMDILGIETAISGPLVSDQQLRLVRDMLANKALKGIAINAASGTSNNIAAALDSADDWRLSGTNTASSLSLASLADMPVLRLAADECFVNLNDATERRVERFDLRGVAEPMEHEPRGLLRDTKIASELRAGDALLVTSDQPDSDEPLPQWQLGIFENSTDLDGETLPTVTALVSAIIREIVNFGAATVWAERTLRPTDRAEMPDAGLLVRERCGQFGKGIECLQHARLQPMQGI